MDEHKDQPIGEPKPIDPRKGRKILKRMAGIMTIAAGGVIAFAQLLAPTRLSGASRSARLLWQQRQKEIQDTIRLSCSEPAEARPLKSPNQKVPSDR
jgi:hypothetical protein